MHWTRTSLFCLIFWFLGCELDLHNHTYGNPFDLDANSEEGIFPPALIFSPNQVNTEIGQVVPIDIAALEVQGVGGIYAQVKYDSSILSVISVKPGQFFSGDQSPFFLFEDQGGILDVYISYLSSETFANGTGDVATINFQINAEGNALIEITANSELMNPSDIPIKINGYGKGVIIAK